MREQYSRTEALLGNRGMDVLASARVAVFGIGGVGGYVCESLGRSGVGALDLIDDDKVSLSNLNRQIIATMDTIGRYKVDVMKERLLSINPDVDVRVHHCFFLPENADRFPFEEYDYIVDAVDTVTAKIGLVMQAREKGIPVISSMGTGNKLDPERLCVTDLYKTNICPLARVMRRELRKRGVDHLKVVYSEEQPLSPQWKVSSEEAITEEKSAMNISVTDFSSRDRSRRSIPGSVVFVPAAAGIMIGAEVVKDLINNYR